MQARETPGMIAREKGGNDFAVLDDACPSLSENDPRSAETGRFSGRHKQFATLVTIFGRWATLCRVDSVADREVVMTGKIGLGIVFGVLILVVFAPSGQAFRFQAVPDFAAAAASASPELVSALSKEIGATPAQAAGAAGALFGLAKTRLSADQFSQVSNAVPGMDSLLKAAPAMSGAVGTAGALSQAGGGAAGLVSAASAFSKLGLSPDMVSKAIPILTAFVSKSGGANVASLLAGALK